MKKRFFVLILTIIVQQITFAGDYSCNYLKENWKGYVYINSPYGESFKIEANANKDSSPIKFSVQINSDKYVVGELHADCRNGILNLLNAKVDLKGRVYENYLYITGYMGSTFF